MIEELIDKQDAYEVVRDQIAAILRTELDNQVALAQSQNVDDTPWRVKVYRERFNPIEAFRDPQGATNADETPIINVWFDTSSFDKAASNSVRNQKSTTIFNVDCYGFGISKPQAGGGHSPADQAAALAAQRAARLARNILMAGEYTYLGLRKTVWGRWPQSMQAFQPAVAVNTVQRVLAQRLALAVEFSEFSPQVQPVDLDELAIDIFEANDGQVLVQAEYDYT